MIDTYLCFEQTEWDSHEIKEKTNGWTFYDCRICGALVSISRLERHTLYHQNRGDLESIQDVPGMRGSTQ
jgi:hypothetical protein